jgi:hypothetical protein
MADYLHDLNIFAFQSWYFGYVLALALALLTVLTIRMLKLKPHFILWLPTLLMALFCLAVWIADIKILEYLDSCSKSGVYFDEGYQMGKLGKEEYQKWYITAYFETASIKRWLDSSLYYISSAVVFSGIGLLIFKLSLKRRRLNVLRSFALIFIVLSLLCFADRRFAISARLLFQPQDFEERVIVNTFFPDDDGHGLIWGRDITDSDFERKTIIILTRDVPVYSYLSLGSEVKHVFKKGFPLNITEYMALELPSVSGWRYDSRIDKQWKDENGLPHFFIDGYVRINDILRAAGSNRYILRARMMESDILLYNKGVIVPDSIMYAFEPLELYLLLPLALLCCIGWVTAKIIKHKQKQTKFESYL